MLRNFIRCNHLKYLGFCGFFILNLLFAEVHANIKDVLGKPFPLQYQWVKSISIDKEYADTSKIYNELNQWILLANEQKDYSLLLLLKEKKIFGEYILKSDTMRYESDLAKLIEESQKNNFKEIEAFLLHQRAELYWHKKEYSLSLENYLYAYEIYKSFSVMDFPPLIEFLYTLGSRYYYFRDYNSAIKYFKQVWENIPEPYIENRVSRMNTMALCYSNLSMYDSAINYFNQAIHFAQKDNVELWIGIISGNLGYIYLKQGKVDSAIQLYEKNIQLSKKYNIIKDLANSYSGYASLLLLKNKVKESMHFQQEALKIVYQKGLHLNNVIVAKIYPFVAQTFAANKNYTQAYQYLDSAFNAYQLVEKEKNMLYLLGAQHNIDVANHMAEVQMKEKEITEQKYLMRLLIAGIFMLLLFAVIFALQRFQIAKAKKISDIQKQRSDELLLNILPQEVAEELKAHGNAKAKHFENASVLFTDFVNFTQISELLSPQELVAEIHDCFSAFDKIIEKYQMEKIKTIGDAYLAVCGLPVSNEEHAYLTVMAAKEIIQYVQQRKPITQNVKLCIRVGINSGAVVAGIVGIKKFAYDIWGDTVNTAARMEQYSENGKINISGSTFALVKDKIECEYRGKVEAKNKGKIDMYFVNTDSNKIA